MYHGTWAPLNMLDQSCSVFPRRDTDARNQDNRIAHNSRDQRSQGRPTVPGFFLVLLATACSRVAALHGNGLGLPQQGEAAPRLQNPPWAPPYVATAEGVLSKTREVLSLPRGRGAFRLGATTAPKQEEVGYSRRGLH